MVRSTFLFLEDVVLGVVGSEHEEEAGDILRHDVDDPSGGGFADAVAHGQGNGGAPVYHQE